MLNRKERRADYFRRLPRALAKLADACSVLPTVEPDGSSTCSFAASLYFTKEEWVKETQKEKDKQERAIERVQECIEEAKNKSPEPWWANEDCHDASHHSFGAYCRDLWANEKATAPNVAPKLSTVTGLVYTITRRFDTHGRPEPGLDVYYWAALDFHTGKTAWERQFGTGFGFDSWYPGLAIGPNGTLYVGQYGGLTAIRDGR